MNIIKYLKGKGIRRIVQVLWSYKIDKLLQKTIMIFVNNKPLKKIIVIESHNDFDCNGGAIYDYLIDHEYNKTYRIVWLLKHPEKKPSNLPYNVECYPLFSPSLKKDYVLCCAKFLTCDCEILPRLREKQIIIYATHGGITFKNVKGLVNVPEYVSYVLSSSERYDPYICDNYSINYPNKRMLHFGFPSNDVLFKDLSNEFNKICRKKYSHYILWMPTFRKANNGNRNDSTGDLPFGIPLVNNQKELYSINSFLKIYDILLIIKIHPMQDPETVKNLRNQSNIIIVDGDMAKKYQLDNYRMMASADAFLSDYSSATYSYLLLNRPIGFVISDFDDYNRGFSVENIFDYMPGNIIYTYKDLISFFKDVIIKKDDYCEKRELMIDWLYKYKDGNSTERLIKYLKIGR